jgi:FHS family glucose/mannose:H+ symporter-like MFS transporter
VNRHGQHGRREQHGQDGRGTEKKGRISMASQNQTSPRYLMGTACAGLFTFGVMTSFLGATLPELRARAGIDLIHGGTLSTFLYVPQVPMVFLAGPLIDRFGKKLVLAAGFLCSAAAFVGMAYAHSYALVGALLVVLGLGGSSAMAAANTLIPDLYPENPSSALNLGGIFFGVGAVFFPSLVSLMARRLGLVATLWCIALLVGLVAFVAMLQKFPPASMASGFDWEQAKAVAVSPAVIILGCVLFFYSSLEITTSLYIRDLLEKDLGVAARSSTIIFTTFWVMMMVGRLIASQVVKRVRGPQLLLGCSVGAIVGLTLMALAPNALVATAAVVICGLCYAPVFPTTAGTASTYFSRIFGTVFGMLMTPALLSGAVVPPAIGYVAQHQSVRAGIGILAGIAVLLLLTQAIFVSYERRKLMA